MIDEEVTITKEPVNETKTVEMELMHEKITIEKKMRNKQAKEGKDIQIIDSVTNNSKKMNLDRQQRENQSPLPQQQKEEGEEPTKEELESETQFIIPIIREELVITKNPYLKEQVIIKKKRVRETKTIKEEIIHEDISYDGNQISGIERSNSL